MLLYSLPAFAKGDLIVFLSGVARANQLLKKVCTMLHAYSFVSAITSYFFSLFVLVFLGYLKDLFLIVLSSNRKESWT